MVANQATSSSLKSAEKLLINLEKDGKYVKNTREWSRSVKVAFAALGLSEFLMKGFGIPVPKEQAAEALIQRRMDASLTDYQQLLLQQEKVRKGISTQSGPIEVKKEVLEEGKGKTDSEKQNLPNVPNDDIESDDEVKILSSNEYDANNMKQFMEIVRRNAAELAQEETDSMAIEEAKIGNMTITLFVNPLTSVFESEKSHNPKARIRIENGGRLKFYELEDEEMVRKRMQSWSLLKGTIGTAVDISVYRHIQIGNTFALFKKINEHLSIENRSDKARELTDRLSSLEHKPKELFAVFVERVKQLLIEQEEISLRVDPEIILGYVREAIQDSTHDVVSVYELVSTSVASLREALKAPSITTIIELLDLMNPFVAEKEKNAHRMNASRHDDSSTDDDEAKARKREKRRQKRLRKKQEEADALALATKASANNGKNFYGSRACLHFNKPGGCRREKCLFDHVTISSADLEKLEERVRQRAAERKATAEKANAFAVSADVKPVDKTMKLADGLSKEERMNLSLLLAK